MTTLEQQMKQQIDQDRNGLLEQYRAILGRATSPRPGDADALAKILHELEISPADVSSDVIVLSDHARDASALLSEDEKIRRRRRRDEVTAKAKEELSSMLSEVLSGMDLSQLIAVAEPTIRASLPAILTTADEAQHAKLLNRANAIPQAALSERFEVDAAESADHERRQRMRHREASNPRLFGSLLPAA
jgi:hypothetical protein